MTESTYSSVDCLLKLLPVGGCGGLWRILFKELLVSAILLAFLPVNGVVGLFAMLYLACGNFFACGEGVGLIDSPQGDAVHSQGPRDCKKARRELLKENNSLPPESACEQDENLAGLNALSQFGWLHLFSLERSFLVISWVPIVFLDHLKTNKMPLQFNVAHLLFLFYLYK